MASIPHQPMY